MVQHRHNFDDEQDQRFWDDPAAAGRQQARAHQRLASLVNSTRIHPVEEFLASYRREAWRLRHPRLSRLFTWQKQSSARASRPRVWRLPLSRALEWIKDRSRARREGLVVTEPKRAFSRTVIAVSALAGTASVAVLVVLVPLIQADVALARQNWDCAQQVVTRSAAGELFDLREALPDSACPQPLDSNGNALERPVAYVPYRDAANTERAADDIASVEGVWRSSDTWFWVLDAKGVFRRIMGGSGFSAPLLSGYEVLLHQTGQQSWSSKLRTTLGAMVYTATYLNSDDDRAQFVVATMPSINNGGTGWTGALAAAVLADEDDLNLADRCMLAGATWRPVDMLGATEPAQARAAPWAVAIGPRAELCVSRRAVSEAEAQAAIADLAQRCNESRLCLDPPSLDGLSQVDRQAIEQRLAEHKLGSYLAHGPRFSPRPNGLAGMGNSLVDAMRYGNAGGVTFVTPATQRAVVQAGESLRAELADGATVTLAVVDISTPDTLLLGLSTNGPFGSFFTPVDDDGQVQTPAFALASMNKIPLVTWAVGQGIEEVCSGDCEPLAPIIARSTPEIMTVVETDPLGYSRFKESVGYIGEPEAGGAFAEDSIEGSRQRIAPAELIALVAALFHGNASPPAIWEGKAAGVPVDLTALGLDPRELATTRAIFAAPFGPGGTLEGFRETATSAACELVLGKSGTSSAGELNRERGSILVHRCGERLLLTFAFAAHPDGVPTRQFDLAPLHKAAVEAVLNTP